MITVISYPNNEINYSITEPTSTNSSELVKYISIDLSKTYSDKYVEVTFNGEVITLYIQDECKFETTDIAFQNMDGALQIVTMFKERRDNMTVTSSEFKSDRGQPLSGFHQDITFNVNAKTKTRLNSGFVEESMNETFKQLLLSERIWLYKNGLYTPLKIISKNLEYKKRQKERIINYEFEFEFAFNDINNI